MSTRFTNGTYIGSSYTPLSFPGEQGGTYNVIAASYDCITFTQWENGSADNHRIITLTTDTNATRITAQCDLGNSLFGVTPLQFNATDGWPSLSVKAMQGNDTLNMWTFIQPESNNTQTANATTLATYKVYTGNFENHVFDHWSDGSMDRIRTVTIDENTTLTAFYKAGEAAVVVPEGAEEPGHAPYRPSGLTVKKGVSP